MENIVMNTKKIFIHVGLHKTASTYLQERIFPLFQNLTLVSRPYTQQNEAFNKLQYASDPLFSSKQFSKELNLIQESDNNRKILISDENFSGLPYYNFINRGIIAKRLSSLIPDAEIILFLRGQESLVRSHYNQAIKKGWFSNRLDRTPRTHLL